MEEKVVAVKAAFALIGGVLSQALGGYDHYLKVLLLVMAVDILTGIIKAVHGKRVSSSKMRGGLLNKVVILFLVALSVELDHAFLAAIGEPIMIGEFTIQIRNCVIFWFFIEEQISVCENCAELGVPMPASIRSMLLSVESSVNNSTPKAIAKWLKEKFGIQLKLGNETSSSTDTSSAIESSDTSTPQLPAGNDESAT